MKRNFINARVTGGTHPPKVMCLPQALGPRIACVGTDVLPLIGCILPKENGMTTATHALNIHPCKEIILICNTVDAEIKALTVLQNA